MSCCICGQASSELLTQGEDFEYATRPGPFNIVRCASCGHVYLDPLPTPEEIPLLYPPTYYTLNPDSPNAIKGFILKMQTRMGVRRTLKLVEGLSVRSIVDVGCGNADRLLRLAAIFGGRTELIGLDLRHDPATVAAARSKGVTLAEGNVEHDLSALKDNGHDLIILSQVIEHLREPAAALRALAQKLSPGGRLLIETPNVGGLDYRLFKRRYWGHWHIPRHLNLFTRESLAKLVTQSGLHVVQGGYLPSPGPWILSLRNLLGLNSVRRTRGSLRSLTEFISISNLFVVSAFTLLDFATLALGLPTSNQYLLAARTQAASGATRRRWNHHNTRATQAA
jgi:2-polyprenyl-3-methyl-5-hydroxy-6-metoxy-1,4-benzoquinol methylase